MWSTLIGWDPLRYCSLIGGNHVSSMPALLGHKDTERIYHRHWSHHYDDPTLTRFYLCMLIDNFVFKWISDHECTTQNLEYMLISTFFSFNIKWRSEDFWCLLLPHAKVSPKGLHVGRNRHGVCLQTQADLFHKEERLSMFWQPGWWWFHLQTSTDASWRLGSGWGRQRSYLVLWLWAISSQGSVRTSRSRGGQFIDLEGSSLAVRGYGAGYGAGRRAASQSDAATHPYTTRLPWPPWWRRTSGR